jgi:hypothetical protein
MKVLLTLAAFLGFAGCAGKLLPAQLQQESPARSCFAYAESACLVVDEKADPGPLPSPARISEVLQAALVFWDAPADALEAWSIVFSADGAPCGTPDAGACAIWSTREIRVVVPRLGRCPEGALVHELGHTILPGGDPHHTDPRFGQLRSALAGLGC